MNASTRDDHLKSAAGLRRLVLAQPGEVGPMLWAAAYHFLVLFSYFILRPVREAMGIHRGYEDLAWLMTGTLLAMLLVNPIFTALVARAPRRTFIPLTYHFFAFTMLGLFGLFELLPAGARVNLGYGVYIWLSVFNLFVVSVFWAFMADIFNREQAKRLFGFIAVGGTLGALAGPAATDLLVSGVRFPSQAEAIRLQPHAMLVVSFVSLQLAVLCISRLLRLSTMRGGLHLANAPSPLRRGAEPGPGPLEGLRLIVRTPYLLLICLFMLVFTIASSLLYMEQGRIIERDFADQSARTAAFARLDVLTQLLTLTLQLLITGRLMRAIGVGGTLAVVPAITMLGFAALMWRDAFAVLAVFMVLRRALHYALDRPAREVLYTVVGPDAKYKSKSFIDTFIYRGGDALGGWMQLLMRSGNVAVGLLAIPLGAAGVVIAAKLGRLQSKEEGRATDASAGLPPAAGSKGDAIN